MEDILDLGDKVKHPKFGNGTVQMRLSDGENAKVLVKFGAEFGEKKLVVKYAKMKKINERPTLPAGEADASVAVAETPGAEKAE